MSDTGRVEFDTSDGAFVMRALAETAGMGSAERAAYWLEGIAKQHHRGPRRDTWTTARDRAARSAGIEPSMAKRIWQRWRDMRDVSGDVLIKLMVAYEAMCVATEAKADSLRDRRIALRNQNAAVDQGPVPAGRRMGGAPSRAHQGVAA